MIDLIYGKAGKEFYRQYKDKLEEQNFKTLHYISELSLFMTAVSAVFWGLGTMILNAVEIFYYLIVASVTLLFKQYLKRKDMIKYPTVNRIYYCFASFSAAVLIFSNTVMARGNTASLVYFGVFLFCVLLVDYPIRSVVYLTAETIVFIIVTLNIRTIRPDAVKLNIENSIIAYVLDIILIYMVNMYRTDSIIKTQKYQSSSELDKLTGLMNKATSEYMADLYLSSIANSGCALIIIDLDHFKEINDTYGHKQGDAVLAEMGGKLKKIFRATDIVGRFGGDEFIVFMKDVDDIRPAVEKARLIEEEVGTIMADYIKDRLTCSIGISYSAPGKRSFKELFQEADKAVYQAKNNGRAQYVCFDDSIAGRKDIIIIANTNEQERNYMVSCCEEKFRVCEAEDGVMILYILKHQSDTIRAVVADEQLPVMTASEVIKDMKSTLIYRSIPIIVTGTGDCMPEELKNAGADIYIKKPFDIKTFRNCIDDAVKNKETAG